MIPLLVKADIPAAADLLGKTVSDLQDDIEINVRSITGTSKYVTGYTGFSGDVSEQSGNYLALHITSSAEGATITAQLNPERDPVTLDPDGIIIFRIGENSGRIATFTVSKNGTTATYKYDLSQLVLEEL